MRAEPDAVFGGRYLLVDLVASGGMGEVWSATDQVLGRTVAVKVLKTELVDEPTFLERFRAEARSAASLSHQGIAQVYDYGEEDRSAYLVMELVPGEPLSALLAREGALEPDRTLDLVAQAAWALHAAHEGGVVHRDVKPGNLLVTPEGTVKITDFGIARARDAAPLTQTGTVMGTAHYLSPEQAYGNPTTAASDVYCLGVVAFECLSGEKPFPGDNAVEVAMAQVRAPIPPLPDEVPPPVRDLVTQAMAKDPAARPASAAELAHRAEQLRTGGAGLGPGVTPPYGLAAAGAGAAAYGAGALTGSSTSAFDVPDGSGEEGDPGDATGGTPPERSSRLSRRNLAALVLVALVLGAALISAVLSPGDTGQGPEAGDGPKATPSHSSSTPTPTNSAGEDGASPAAGSGDAADGSDTVTVVAADYIGRPYGDVRGELTGMGLKVSPRYQNSGEPPGTVTGVSPDGEVERGSTVVVTVAKKAPASPEPAPEPSSPKPTPEPTTSSPSPTPSAPATTESPPAGAGVTDEGA